MVAARNNWPHSGGTGMGSELRQRDIADTGRSAGHI